MMPDKQTEALKLALEALEYMAEDLGRSPSDIKAITAIRKALTKQPAQQQEPVARFISRPGVGLVLHLLDAGRKLPEGRHDLYKSPHPSKPLTDEEIEEIWRRVEASDFHDCVQPFARAIEAAHGIKEKNT